MFAKMGFGLTIRSTPIRGSALSVLTLWVVCVSFECHHLRAQSPPTNPAGARIASDATQAASPGSESTQPEGIADRQPEPGEVAIDGRKVLKVYQAIGNFSAKDRAEKITERLLAAASEGTDPNSVTMKPKPMWTEISVDGKLLLAVSDEDAIGAGKPRATLAAEDVESIRQALIDYQRDHSVRAISLGIFYSAVATAMFVLIALLLRKIRLSIRARLGHWIENRKPHDNQIALEIATTYSISILRAIGSALLWLLLLLLFQTYITVVLRFFPQTRPASHAMTAWIISASRSMGESLLAYLPNLFIVALVILIATQVSRLTTALFEEIKNGNLSISGFYSEWAEPSARIFRGLILILTIIIVFPYLPGSKSPAFQGISIFVGVLLSLGSSSAVANAIAGVILTYMRPFSVGDWVKIGDTLGEIEEKSILVTRILTPKHETITIPNSAIMGGSVMNFTREAKRSGVIFHTTVTIGYDAPWRIVHQLLIDAAAGTEGVLRNPSPFVLQTQLNDFYVTYELNAYTDTPNEMESIYSHLHQNIQDRFNEAGVEICSPHFTSLRDGNTIAIPAQYISADYTAPGFRLDEARRGAEQTTSNRR